MTPQERAYLEMEASLRLPTSKQIPISESKPGEVKIPVKTPRRMRLIELFRGTIIKRAPPAPVNGIPPLRMIADVVAKFYGIHYFDICGERRSKSAVNPRHVGMYLCKELTPASFPKIGRAFGGRDHTTALYGFRKVQERLLSEPSLFLEIEEIKRRIFHLVEESRKPASDEMSV